MPDCVGLTWKSYSLSSKKRNRIQIINAAADMPISTT